MGINAVGQTDTNDINMQLTNKHVQDLKKNTTDKSNMDLSIVFCLFYVQEAFTSFYFWYPPACQEQHSMFHPALQNGHGSDG